MTDNTVFTTENEMSDPLTAEERVELGVELLAHIETNQMSISEIITRIETVTTVAPTQREILDAAEGRGVIVRNPDQSDTGDSEVESGTGSGVYLPGTKVVEEEDVERREGDFSCERCGASLSTGHFVTLNEHEHGPFGPECVRIVLGRDG